MKKVTVLSALFALMVMSGCDSSSDSSGDSASTGAGGSSLVGYSCEDSISYNGKTTTSKSGYEGDVLYNCKLKDPTYGYALANGVTSLNVVNVVHEFNSDVKCPSYNANVKVTLNHQENSITYVGNSSKEGSVNCKEVYTDMGMPATFSDKKSIDAILNFDTAENKNDPKLVSTSCPDWTYEGADSGDTCSGTIMENITITDDAGKTHKVSIESKYNI